MSNIITMPPPACVSPLFADPFAALAQTTGALPYELPSIARFGEDSVSALPPQIPPLLAMDGSPRKKLVTGLVAYKLFNEFLDMRLRDIVPGIYAADFTSSDYAHSMIDVIESGATLRKVIAEFRGEASLAALASGLRGFFKRASEEARENSDALIVRFAIASAAAASPILGEEGAKDFIELVHAIEDDEENRLPLPHSYEAKALIYENLAAALSWHREERVPFDSFDYRFEASDNLRTWAMLKHNAEALSGIGRRARDTVFRHILNGAQIKPDGRLDGVLTEYFPPSTVEEMVTRHLVAAWAQLIGTTLVSDPIDEGVAGNSATWNAICSHLLVVAEVLRGKNRHFTRAQQAAAFRWLDRASLAKQAERLAFDAVMNATVAEKRESAASSDG